MTPRLLSALLLLSVSALPAHADGPLAELLAEAPAFDAQFRNMAGNDATLHGNIAILLTAPSLPAEGDRVVAGPHQLSAPPPARPEPVSTIATLSSSVMGVLQTGTMDITAEGHGPGAPRAATLAQMPATATAPELLSAPPPQVLSTTTFTLQNLGTNTGDVDGSISARVQGQGLTTSDLSTSAIGAMASGQISIVVNSD